MAVFTPVSEDAAKAFLADYDIGELEALEPIAEGVENTNYKMTAGGRGYVLTLFEKRTRAEELPQILGLTSQLASRGFPTPSPVPRRDGAMLGRLNERPAVVITWARGAWLKAAESDELGRAGAALADLHLLSDERLEMPVNRFGPEGWRELAAACASRHDRAWRPVVEEMAARTDALAAAWPEDLPTGPIHGDYFPDNVLFYDGRVSGVIDFYFACRDARAYDLAIALNAWCFTSAGDFRPEASAAFAAGYASRRPLTPAERAAMPALCLGAAVRFTLTRLYDVLHADPSAMVRLKDPVPFAKRCAYHAGVEDAEAYGL